MGKKGITLNETDDVGDTTNHNKEDNVLLVNLNELTSLVQSSLA